MVKRRGEFFIIIFFYGITYLRIIVPFIRMGEGKMGDGGKDASTPTPRSKKG